MTCDTNRVIAGLFVQQAGNCSIPHRLICSMYVQKEGLIVSKDGFQKRKIQFFY